MERGEDVLNRLTVLVNAPSLRIDKARAVAEVIQAARAYRWVGLYDVTPDEVVAIAWTGADAPAYPRFPVTKGLSGAAVATREPVVVQDVTTDPRYLTAFGSTRAEAIIPVAVDGRVVGTIDVESDRIHAFSREDEEFLKTCSSILTPLWVLSTPRCVLRPIAAGDANPLHDLWSSPGVRRFLWDDEVIPLARTVAMIDQNQWIFGDQGAGLWGVWPTDSPNLGGFAGLWPLRDPPELELVYGVSEHLWGRGYATEVAQAVIAYCFGSYDLPVIRASTDAPNTASIRVLEKLGFGFVRRSTVGSLDTVFYELSRRAAKVEHQPVPF